MYAYESVYICVCEKLVSTNSDHNVYSVVQIEMYTVSEDLFGHQTLEPQLIQR